MNNILVVGHPASGIYEVEEALNGLGIQRALPSRREGLSATKIAATIRKSSGVASISSKHFKRDLRQIEVSPVWQSLLLDLYLGNCDQECWGWADPNLITLLGYWKSIDPQVGFVFVYDEPHRLLGDRSGLDCGNPDRDCIDTLLKNWAAYYRLVLKFTDDNAERCFLMSAQNIGDSVDELLSSLKAKFPKTKFREDFLKPPESGVVLCSLDRFVVDQVLNDYSEVREVFAKLQGRADLPMKEAKVVNSREALIDLASTRASVEQLRFSRSEETQHFEGQIKKFQQDRDLLLTQLKIAHDEMKCQYEELQRWRTKAERIASQQSRKLQKSSSSKSRRKTPKKPVGSRRVTGAAERVKQQLSYRVGSVIVSRSKNPFKMASIPWALIREFRDFRNARKRQMGKTLPPIHTYEDAAKADRVKNQLSYRIGNAVVKNSRSPIGWIRIPFAIVMESKNFYVSKKSRRGENQLKSK